MMPLLHNKPFESAEPPPDLDPSEEVFFCDLTCEIFTDYTEFCERIILCNSLVWSCSITGRSKLTYMEAVASEQNALEMLMEMPFELRVPLFYLASRTERKSLAEMSEDVFAFARDRYFVGERVEVKFDDTWVACHVLQALLPTSQPPVEIIKTVQAKAGSVVHWPLASDYRYEVERLDSMSDDEINIYCVLATEVRRKKGAYTRDRNKILLKHNAHEVDGICTLTDYCLLKYGLSRIKFSHIFVGNPPIFKSAKPPAKKNIQQSSQKKRNLADGKRQESIDKYFTKSPTKMLKPSMPRKGEITPQKMAQKVKEKYKDAAIKKNAMKKWNNSNATEKKDILKLKQKQKNKYMIDVKKIKVAKLSDEELERLSLEKKARRLRIRQEKRMEKQRLAEFVREWNKQREDLECEDLKELPEPLAVELKIPNSLFGDFVMILEFMHSFRRALPVKHFFPSGVTFDLVERALVEKEIAGPLSDILQLLLVSIFNLQDQEEDEINEESNSITTAVGIGLESDMTASEAVELATAASKWSQRYQGMPLNKLTLDAVTLSEVLRLHLLSSGGRSGECSSKWRYDQRGGYSSQDDPGLSLRMNQPHILRFLSQSNVCELPVGDKLAVMTCLINQIMTFSDLRDEIDERVDKTRLMRLEFKTYQKTQHRKKKELALQLKELKKTGATREIERLCENDRRHHCDVLKKAREVFEVTMAGQVNPLGLDRAFRRFWLFSALPGLYVEHDERFPGSCLPKGSPLGIGDEETVSYVRRLFEQGSNKENATSLLSEGKGGGGGSVRGSPAKKLLCEKNGEASWRDSSGGMGVGLQDRPFTAPVTLTCSGQQDTCSVHAPPSHRMIWGFYHSESELNMLIEALSRRGERERQLKAVLIQQKERILHSLANCPGARLNSTLMVDDADETEQRKPSTRSTNRYENANLSYPPGTPTEEILESMLRDTIIETEEKIDAGGLGTLKVKNRTLWKDALLNNRYDQQCEKLVWGGKHQPHSSANNGQASANEMDEEDSSRPSTPSSEQSYNPNKMLGCESIGQSVLVRSLASALLQVEQSIETNYLQKPLGTDNDEDTTDNESKKLTAREKWEISLMSSTSLSQIFLHLSTIDNSIQWSCSALNAFCRLCRRRGDAENMLLCDSCNKGHHLYCLKPKLTTVPKGDWFCTVCRPRETLPIIKKRSRKIFREESDEESEPEKENMKTAKCKRCSSKGAQLTCDMCNTSWHLDCAEPVVRKEPKGGWTCHACRKGSTKRDEPSCSISPPQERSSRRRCAMAATANISKFAQQLRSNSWDGEDTDNDSSSQTKRRSRRSLEADPSQDLPLDNAALQEVLEQLIRHEDAWPFLKPVSRVEVPDYHVIVKQPMDLATIRHKLNMLEYRNTSEVLADVHLVFDNCHLYNREDSDVYQCGTKLRRTFQKLCKERKLKLNVEEVRPPSKRSRTSL